MGSVFSEELPIFDMHGVYVQSSMTQESDVSVYKPSVSISVSVALCKWLSLVHRIGLVALHLKYLESTKGYSWHIPDALMHAHTIYKICPQEIINFYVIKF